MNDTLDELIAKEQHRRARLKRQQRPYYHWQERGDTLPPLKDVWCDYCQGYFGVPHDNIHVNPFTGLAQYCPEIGKALTGRRTCACLDCYCAEIVGGPNSLASRITQA
jgi:hypothetical protein